MSRTSVRHDTEMMGIVKESMNVNISADQLLSIMDISAAFDSIVDYIQDNFEPADIFDKGELDNWAENNGYIKADIP